MKANTKKFVFIALSAFVLSACGEKKSAEENVVSEVESTEVVQEAQETPTEEIPAKIEEEKKYLDSVLGIPDSETWVNEQTEFTEFSTPLAIGDEIILQSKQTNQDAIWTWKNTSCMSTDNPLIKHR